MKTLGTAMAALLFFVLGSSFAAFAQEQHEDEAKPPAHQEEARPTEHPETEAPPPRQEAPRPEVQPHQPEARPATQPPRPGEAPRPQENAHAQATPEQRRMAQTAWQSHRAQNWQSQHRTWQQRGGYHGYRIPEARYSAYFGPSHVFPIYSVPISVVGGYPRFQYQGFWFTVVDPWPATWASDWYYNDNVYIIYTDGGYYLVNPAYPGVELAVNVSL